jgi:hypothetical protein
LSIRRVISGGQTGVDRGALDAALEARFPCGGWCPSGRLAEDGPIDARYPVVEMEQGGYEQRTRQNVLDSDGTAIIYFGELSGGTEFTLSQCMLQKKPYTLIDAAEISETSATELIVEFVRTHSVETLNVAGPRQSSAPEAHNYARRVIAGVISQGVQRHGGKLHGSPG